MERLFPIMVKVWAGAQGHDFRYIRRSLPSLLSSNLPAEARVIFINDRSQDPRVEGFLRSLAAGHPAVEVWTNPQRLGPNRGQEYNFPRVVGRFPDAPYYALCDDDIIYHPGWLQRLIAVYEEAKAEGLQGIFAALNIPAKPSCGSARLATSEVVLKPRQPALNWLLPREVYEAVGPFRDVGIAYDHDYWDRMATFGWPAVCLKPSYVQNIGYHGAYQSDDSQTAQDYVGTRDVYLICRDLWCALNRNTVGRARLLADRIPDGRVKRAVARLARGVRGWVATPRGKG